MVPFMKRVFTTPSTSDVYFLSSKATHRCCAFYHGIVTYVGGGDIMTTLSPLTTMDPRLLESPSEGISLIGRVAGSCAGQIPRGYP